MEQIQTPETSSLEVTQNGELREVLQPALTIEELGQQFKDFELEKETLFQHMNGIRKELGAAPTFELPVYMKHKEDQLLKLQHELQDTEKPKHGHEYIDFEMIEESPEKKQESKEQIKGKLESLYAELKAIPPQEYHHLQATGVLLSGRLFQSVAFGVLKPEILKRLLIFYETHPDPSDEAVVESFVVAEPAFKEPVKEAKQLEYTEQKRLPNSNSTNILENMPEQRLLENGPSEDAGNPGE